MSRVARRLAILRVGGAPGDMDRGTQRPLWSAADETTLLGPDQLLEVGREAFDTSPRARAARSARAALRRMEPVVLLAPRWSATERFLEDLAQDLAVGEPTVACRVVGFRHLQGRGVVEAWRHTLQLLGRLVDGAPRAELPSGVADRRGFRWALDELLETIHEKAMHRTALLAHGCDALPVELLDDLVAAWRDYYARHPEHRRVTSLFAAADTARWLAVEGRPIIYLADYAETEALAAMVGRAGPKPLRSLERAARFTGGIPALVERLADYARVGGALPSRPKEILDALGGLAEELRGAVDIVCAHELLAERLASLQHGEPTPMVPELDRQLITAGLLRPLRTARGPEVALRAPAIALFVT